MIRASFTNFTDQTLLLARSQSRLQWVLSPSAPGSPVVPIEITLLMLASLYQDRLVLYLAEQDSGPPTWVRPTHCKSLYTGRTDDSAPIPN